ncbi:MAG: hypothetical protein Q4A07_00550 [Coriobacteriales bacterium]|nr:hypothetical protein [Coriobacteriales bacterium]
MSEISNYKPADYYWMHSKGEYATAIAKGMVIGGLLGLLVGFLGQAAIDNLFPWLAIGGVVPVCILCAIIGGTLQVIRLKREDSKAKQANFDTAIDVLARSILSEEE